MDQTSVPDELSFQQQVSIEQSTVGHSEWHQTLDLAAGAPESVVPLPPMDTGFHAYAYLISAFMVEFLVWSIVFSYGVFLDHYTSELFDKDDPQINLLPLIGSLATGLIYLAGLPCLTLINRYPAYKGIFSLVGLILCVVGLLGAAFSTRPMHLLFTQGIIFSLGGTLFYFPIYTFLPEWFSRKRGLANGLLYSGTGLGGTVVPFLVKSLLHGIGHRWTFIILAATFGLLGGLSIPYAKARLPVAQVGTATRLDISFIKDRAFWVLLAGNTIQGLANFLPGIYIPSFANELNLTTLSGTIALALMNAASVPGVIVIGAMTDNVDLRLVISMSTLGSAFAILLVWGFSSRLGPLLVFAVLFGFFGGGYSSMWPKFISVVTKDDPHLYSTLIGIFSASRGLGNVLSGPISTGLMREPAIYHSSRATYGYTLDGYASLIMYSGLVMLASTVAVAYPHVMRQPGPSSIQLRQISVNRI